MWVMTIGVNVSLLWRGLIRVGVLRCTFFLPPLPNYSNSSTFPFAFYSLNTFLELKIENERLNLVQEYVHRTIASIPSSLLTSSLALPTLSAVGFAGYPQTFFTTTPQDSVSVGVGAGVGGGVGVGDVKSGPPTTNGNTYGILASTAFGYSTTLGYEDESESTASGQKRKVRVLIFSVLGYVLTRIVPLMSIRTILCYMIPYCSL